MEFVRSFIASIMAGDFRTNIRISDLQNMKEELRISRIREYYESEHSLFKLAGVVFGGIVVWIVACT
jgi:hypothetical protein